MEGHSFKEKVLSMLFASSRKIKINALLFLHFISSSLNLSSMTWRDPRMSNWHCSQLVLRVEEGGRWAEDWFSRKFTQEKNILKVPFLYYRVKHFSFLLAFHPFVKWCGNERQPLIISFILFIFRLIFGWKEGQIYYKGKWTYNLR